MRKFEPLVLTATLLTGCEETKAKPSLNPEEQAEADLIARLAPEQTRVRRVRTSDFAGLEG